MKFTEHFVAGRLRRRRLRSPVLTGWLCDERTTRPPQPVELPLKKLGELLALQIPGRTDLAKLSREATAIAAAQEEAELLLGWPEAIVIVRTGGALLYGEGDVVHFGPLSLDSDHSIMRSGYQYLSETGSEVRVELTLTAGEVTSSVMLDPGSKVVLGPYDIEHDHSFDPSDRPGGARHHGYFFRVRRRPGLPPPAPPSDLPHPLDVTQPITVVTLARKRALLSADEALAAEPTELARLLDRYEGPRQNLEQAIRDTGPTPPTLSRLGETVVIESACVQRGSKGEALLGRATVTLDPTGDLAVFHAELAPVPGRLRRSHVQV